MCLYAYIRPPLSPRGHPPTRLGLPPLFPVAQKPGNIPPRRRPGRVQQPQGLQAPYQRPTLHDFWLISQPLISNPCFALLRNETTAHGVDGFHDSSRPAFPDSEMPVDRAIPPEALPGEAPPLLHRLVPTAPSPAAAGPGQAPAPAPAATVPGAYGTGTRRSVSITEQT